MSGKSPSDLGSYINLSQIHTRVILLAAAFLAAGVLAWCFFGTMTDKEYVQGVVFPSEGTSGVSIPNGGVVKDIFIHKGDMVNVGDPLALVSVNGAYSIVSAPFEGEVLSYLPENESFEAFQDIITLLSGTSAGELTSVTAYANFKAKRFIAPGQTAQVTPTNETRERVGYVRAKVVSVSPYPISKKEAVLKFQNASLADQIFPDDASVFEVQIELQKDKKYPDRLDWSFAAKERVDMSVGTFCNIEVIVKSRNVFHYLLENVQETENSIRLWASE